MQYRCQACAYIYDEVLGVPSMGIPPNTRWERLSNNFICPRCRFPKSKFTPVQPVFNSSQETNEEKSFKVAIEGVKSHDNMHQMSYGELSALCSHLANSCEIQYLFHEAQQFTVLADYYKTRTCQPMDASIDKLAAIMENDLAEAYVRADVAAQAANDRGAKRILKWSQGVTSASSEILSRYKSQGDAFLQNTGVYICEICGYIFIGDTLPRGCPVCHVSNIKIQKVG